MILPETFVKGFHDEAAVINMPYIPLGKTGLKVSKISLGTGGFSYLYGDNYTLEECKETVLEAIKSGINFIDTSPWYGHGESETILGKCLEGIPREAYYLATKVGRYEKDPAKMFDFSSKKVLESIDESLKRLNLEYVDLLQAHDIEFAPSLEIILNETLPSLKKIIEDGKAKHLGITGYPLSTLKECIEKSSIIDIETVLSYSRCSMIDDSLKDYADFLHFENIGVINAAVNAMGLLTNEGPPNWHPAGDDIKKVCKEAADYCKSKDVELGRLAVYEGLQQIEADTVLIGMNNRKVLKNNLDVLIHGITVNESEVLEEVKKILSKLPRNANWEGVELELSKQSKTNFI